LKSNKRTFFKNKNEIKKKLEEKETLTCPCLENKGIPGPKFKFKQINENKYKPWECLTLKCKKFIKYHSDPKKQNEITN